MRSDQINGILTLNSYDEEFPDDKTSLLTDNNHPFEPLLDIDDFINELEFGIFHFIIVVASGFCYSTVSLLTQSATLLTTFACDLDIDSGNYGWQMLCMTIGTLLGSVILGRLSDTFGRRTILLFSMSLNLIMTITSALAYNYLMLIILALINGIGFGGIFTSVHAYCLEFFPAKYRGRAIACLTACVIFGSLYSSGMACLLLPHPIHLPFIGKLHLTAWRLYLLVCTFPIVISLILLAWAPDSPRFMLKKGETEKVIQIINKIYRTNSYCHSNGHLYRLVAPSNLSMSPLKAYQDSTDKQTSKPFTLKYHLIQLVQRPIIFKLIGLSITWFGYCFCFSGLWVMLPTVISFYVNGNTCHHHNYSSTRLEQYFDLSRNSVCLDNENRVNITLYILYGNLLSIPVAVVCILLINIIGRKKLFSCIALLTSLSIFLIWAIDKVLSTIILAGMFAGIIISAWIPLKLLSSESFPTELRSTSLGILTVFGGFGSLCGIVSFTSLFDSNCTASFMLLVIHSLLAGITVMFIPDTSNASID